MDKCILSKFRLLTLLAAALAAGCGGSDEGDVLIRRTEFGIPHITALTPRGIGLGAGYVFAEDNLCLLADAVVTINGERSRYFGPTATYDSYASPTQANLSSDFFYKYLNDPALVKASWSRQPREVQDLLKGYAAGYNQFLAQAAKKAKPPACATQPWVRELTELDLIRLMRRFAVEASGARFIDAFYAAQPPAAPASGTPMHARRGEAPGATAQRPAAFWDRFKTDLGSNAVALGKDATESGAGLLLANPHYPWGNIFRFYQMHLTIPGKLDVMGAAITGSPVVNIGFNKHLAWSHTVNTSRHFTLFYLQLDPADPTRYLVDGQSRPMVKKTLSVEIGTGPSAPPPIQRDYYYSDHGPLVTLPGTLDWSTQAAFAFRDANFDNDRLFQQWWELDKATSLKDFRAAVEGTMGIPWANTVATDRAGNLYYADVTPVPFVPTALETACIAAPFRPLLANGIYVLAGNTAACNWADDASTPQRGIFPSASLPTLQRTDYLQNSNDSAWMTHPAQRAVGYPSIVSRDATPLSGRTRIGLTQIAQRLSGADGRPGHKFDMASLQDIAFSNRSYFATVLLADLRTACGSGGAVTLDDGSNADIGPACNVLSAWDGKAELPSIGWPLFLAWREAMDRSGLDYWLHPFDQADPVGTPSGLRLGDPAVTAAARKALALAANGLQAQKIDFTKPWGQIQSFTRGSQHIPIHGGAGNEIYNQIVADTRPEGRLEVTGGSSTVWTISFEGGSPKAQGFLSYSQSTDPASPHHADQTPLFSQKRWITYPFSEAEIRRSPTLELTVLHDRD